RDNDDVSMPDPRMPEPGAQPRIQLPRRYEFTPPPPTDDASPGPARGSDEGAQARPLTPPPGLGHAPYTAPSDADLGAAPPGARGPGGGLPANNGPVNEAPAAIPSMPQLDQRNRASQPPRQWKPSVDPAERWAPR